MVRRRSEWASHTDDLRSGFDRDDDERVRDALERSRSLAARRPPEVQPPTPISDAEIVCRSCRLVVPRGELGDVILLVCRDCYR